MLSDYMAVKEDSCLLWESISLGELLKASVDRGDIKSSADFSAACFSSLTVYCWDLKLQS